MENSAEYYYLNINVNISSFSPLNTNVNTILKYYHKQALNKKQKLIRGAMTFFTKNLLGQEIFSSMIPLSMKTFFEKFVKQSGSLSCRPCTGHFSRTFVYTYLNAVIKRLKTLSKLLYKNCTCKLPLLKTSWPLRVQGHKVKLGVGFLDNRHYSRYKYCIIVCTVTPNAKF